MGFIAVTCPSCSAHLEIDEASNSCYCSYCGTLVERERININVSGSVKLDQSGQQDNFRKLAESAFSAGNYAEAYRYYAKVLEISISDARAVFRKGLCAGYLSLNSGAFRIVEVMEGYTSAMLMLGKDEDTKSRFTGEYIALAIAYSSPLMKHSGTVFADNAAFMFFCNEYQVKISQIYDMYCRVPTIFSNQCESFLSHILRVCSCAEQKYHCYYYINSSSGPPRQMKKLLLMPTNTRGCAKSIADKCRMNYMYLPHIIKQSKSLNEEIAVNQGKITVYENAYNAFGQSNPQYLSQMRSIKVGGTLLVILITVFSCVALFIVSVLTLPYLLVSIPAAIIAACLVWKKMKAKKLAELDSSFLPPEIVEMRKTSDESKVLLERANNKKASLVLK